MDGAGDREAPRSHGGPALRVTPVEGKRDLERFLRFPFRLHRGHPFWVPPLLSEQRSLLDPRRNPFWRHAELHLFLAERGGRVEGRIAAIVNHAHNEFHRERVGFFGFYEARDDPAVTRALVDAVEASHRDAGMSRLRGPVNPSMGSECGLLVEGFDAPPAIMMPYNPPYYGSHLEACGLTKEMDLLTFVIDQEDPAAFREIRERIAGLAAVAERRHPGMRIRPLDPSRFREDAYLLRDLFDGARRENYGFVPSSEEEYERLVARMRSMFDPVLVQILELEDGPAGCIIGLPDWNVALKRSAGWPGFLRLLRILAARRGIRRARILAIALSRGVRRSGLASVLIHQVLEEGSRRGYESAELSWVAENNTVQLQTLEGLVGRGPVKRYRIYSKAIRGAPAGD